LLGPNVGSVPVYTHGEVDEAEFAKNLQKLAWPTIEATHIAYPHPVRVHRPRRSQAVRHRLLPPGCPRRQQPHWHHRLLIASGSKQRLERDRSTPQARLRGYRLRPAKTPTVC